MVHLAQTMHLYCNDTNTVSKRIETRFHMAHSSRTSIRCVQDNFWAYSMLGTNRAPILYQDSYYLQTDSNKLPLDPRHQGVSSGAPKWFLSQWYIRRKPCTYIAPTVTLSLNGLKRDSTWPTHLGVPSGASKTIFEPMVHSTQTAQLSCFNINTISKRSRTSFNLSLITLEYRRVHPKQFLSRWYVRHKPCTYIALTLTLSPNRQKRDSTWPTRLGLPSGAFKTISKPMVRLAQTTHPSCVWWGHHWLKDDHANHFYTKGVTILYEAYHWCIWWIDAAPWCVFILIFRITYMDQGKVWLHMKSMEG
jgi:hypothetical protein